MLNLSNSSLAINRKTGDIAILDDNNHRVIIFNQSNTSTLIAILSDSSNSTNKSIIRYSPSAITYDQNNTIYVLDLDGQGKQIMKMSNPLTYGQNTTTVLKFNPGAQYPLLNGSTIGICVDSINGTIFISNHDRDQIIRYNQLISSSSGLVYIGNGTAGNANNQLKRPRSIVMGVDRTL